MLFALSFFFSLPAVLTSLVLRWALYDFWRTCSCRSALLQFVFALAIMGDSLLSVPYSFSLVRPRIPF